MKGTAFMEEKMKEKSVCRRREFLLNLIVFLLFAFLVGIGGSCKKEKALPFATVKIPGMNQTLSYDDGKKAIENYSPIKPNEELKKLSLKYYDTKVADIEPTEVTQEGPLMVLDCIPQGEVSNEMSRQFVATLLFSKPMVSLAKLGDPITAIEGIRIEPELEGVFRWYGAQILSFESSVPLSPMKIYKLKVDKTLKSASGKALERSYEFSFYSEELQWLSCDVATNEEIRFSNNDIPPAYAHDFRLTFSYPVDISYLKSFFSVVSNQNGKNYSFNFLRDSLLKKDENRYQRTVLLHIEEEFPEQHSFSIIMKKGAAPDAFSNGTTKEVQRNFQTLKPFRFERYTNDFYGSSTDSNPVYLEFSHEIDKASVPNQIQVSFEVEDLEKYVSIYGKTIKLNNLPVEFDSTYDLYLLSGIRDIYGRNLMPQTVRVEVGPALSYFYCNSYGFTFLEAGYPPKLGYEFQNAHNFQMAKAKIINPFTFKIPSLQAVNLAAERNVRYFKQDDFSHFLNEDGKGMVYVGKSMDVKQYDYFSDNFEYRTENNYSIVQVTDLGVTVRYAYDKAIVWVKSLSTGKAEAGARVEILSDGKKEGFNLGQVLSEGITDQQGKLVLSYNSKKFPAEDWNSMYVSENRGKGDLYFSGLIFRISKGKDQIYFSPTDEHNRWNFDVQYITSPSYVQTQEIANLCFCDRGLYRPGETLKFKGVAQKRSVGEYEPVSGSVSVLSRRLGYQEKAFYQTTIALSENGGYDGFFVIPKTAVPGSYEIEVQIDQRNFYVHYQVSEFKRAEFEVAIQKPVQKIKTGDVLRMEAAAQFLSGGRMKNAKCQWYWTVSGTNFNPGGENFNDWIYGPSDYEGSRMIGYSEGTLDDQGMVVAEQKTTASMILGRAQLYTLQMAVQDLSRQEIASQASVVVHPADFYLGAKLGKAGEGWWSRFVEAKKPLSFSFVVQTTEGESYNKKVNAEISIIKKEREEIQQQGVAGYINYRYQNVDKEILKEKITLNGKGAFSFVPPSGGEYCMKISAVDDQNRNVVTEIEFYATGSSWISWVGEDAENIELIPEKKLYKVGEKANIFMKTPMGAGDYLMTIEREGFFEEKIIQLEGATQMLEVEVKEEYLPIFYVAVTAASKRTSDPPTSPNSPDLGKPKSYFGITGVEVETKPKELEVEILPSHRRYLPGMQAGTRIYVRKNGKPVSNAEITFLAVDRGVLDLINYHVPNPVAFFYDPERFPHAVTGGDSRSLLVNPINYSECSLQGGDSRLKMAEGKDRLLRKDFNPLAIFTPSVMTNEEGYADVLFDLPDTLTTYRSTAFVVAGNQFGYSERELFVQNPVTVRTAAPQALRLRDQSTISVLLTNLTSETQKVKITAVSDLLKLKEKELASKKVSVAPEESVEVPFVFQALMKGVATIEFKVESDPFNEILREKIEVLDVPVKEAFTIAGSVGTGSGADSTQQNLIIPSEVDPSFGGLKVRLSSTPFTALASAVEFLNESGYRPYNFVDYYYRSFASMLLGTQANVLCENGFSKKDLDLFMAQLEEKLQSQNGLVQFVPYRASGDFYWSAKIAEYLYFAKSRGFSSVSNEKIKGLVRYLVSFDSQKEENLSLYPYLLYVRSLYGENVSTLVQKQLQRGDELGNEGYLYCGLALAACNQIEEAKVPFEKVKKKLLISTQSVSIRETFEKSHFWSDPVLSLSLFARLSFQIHGKEDPLLLQYANSIASELTAHWWRNRESALHYILLAEQTDKAFSLKNEKASKKIDVKVMLGGKNLFEKELSVAHLSSFSHYFPMYESPLSKFPRDKNLPFDFVVEGNSSLYYSATLEYGLPAEMIGARDEGMSVLAKIYTLEGEEVANTLTLGKTYRMKVTVASTRNRVGLALKVPIPSGCDAINGSFLTSHRYENQGGIDNRNWKLPTIYGDTVDSDSGSWCVFCWMLFHSPTKAIYKNEVGYQFGYFPAGQQSLEFLFRATTAGIYPTPPAQAQLMAESEVFGRSAGKIYTIK